MNNIANSLGGSILMHSSSDPSLSRCRLDQPSPVARLFRPPGALAPLVPALIAQILQGDPKARLFV